MAALRRTALLARRVAASKAFCTDAMPAMAEEGLTFALSDEQASHLSRDAETCPAAWFLPCVHAKDMRP